MALGISGFDDGAGPKLGDLQRSCLDCLFGFVALPGPYPDVAFREEVDLEGNVARCGDRSGVHALCVRGWSAPST